jgi:hypothetical protein
MRICVCSLILIVISVFLTVSTVAAESKQPSAVPTFECLGLYWPSELEQDECQVKYRRADQKSWRDALPLVYDSREKEYRGSLVGLKPGTEYSIKLSCGDKNVEFSARTRSEQFPIGKTTFLKPGETDQPLHITESGTSNAWHLVTITPGAKTVIDVFNMHNYCIDVEANYVIIRGLELKNAIRHGVRIRKRVQNVVVEDCHITKWGRIGGAKVWGVRHGSDSAVYAETGAGGLIIQRNLMDHPRSGSSDWESGHPDGPQGISMKNSSGRNIIRYNEIRSTEDHGFNDGIGGGSNFSFQGSPNRDSDIYGNIITNCWDDAIESEGANMNVRIWGNYIDKTFQFIATASTSMGPFYIYRNVFGTSRITHQDSTGGNIIKASGPGRTITVDGEKVFGDRGRRYIFHNTTLQPNGALHVGLGGVCNVVSKNNIFRVRGSSYSSGSGDGPPNDFSHNLTGSYLGGGFVRSMFIPSDRLEWFLATNVPVIKWGKIKYSRSGEEIIITDPLVQAPNPALDKGVRLAGFNDDYKGEAPDIGAFENGNEPLRFGREAAPGFERAPWEL